MKSISIVVPVYNEQENIENFYEEVVKCMQPLNYGFELIFVDDGSKDASAMLLDRLAQKDERVRALLLARNFGHQIALTCGLDYADGDAVITMDGDMQHPPEMLPMLIGKWEEGYEVVQTVRLTTEGVSWTKTAASNMYYKIINWLSTVHIQEGGSDFRLMDKKVVSSFRRFRERARFIRGMIGEIGYKQINVEFVAPKRFAGRSKFSLNKMLHFALDGITAYSKLPLRFAFYIGLICGLLSLLVTLHVVYIRLFTGEAVPGWATISASILLLGGLQLAGLGIIGEYVGRIFEEVKQRPLYLVSTELKKQRIFDNKAYEKNPIEGRILHKKEE
ncbi:glycosyltransferase family 2 protein|uniref:Dolichol-phosphate mannosyltransferase n=1 Tax=Dendrosporobacter quercicolus TaxID=146817 RepID=A0A1G9MMQ0_9FIRM|nr:glycosyltransferase family 2 protein [Dendrosporobacter quercicolus]NSL47086.1 glycosyltransferase family 2 protein [Dendrosporobacter quercicolus DSM 1736]SDL75562.1 dolichol-phosphate mannosyltransferase [Dendrosporobacter quercicolus]